MKIYCDIVANLLMLHEWLRINNQSIYFQYLISRFSCSVQFNLVMCFILHPLKVLNRFPIFSSDLHQMWYLIWHLIISGPYPWNTHFLTINKHSTYDLIFTSKWTHTHSQFVVSYWMQSYQTSSISPAWYCFLPSLIHKYASHHNTRNRDFFFFIL